jgi:hypothetical protein
MRRAVSLWPVTLFLLFASVQETALSGFKKWTNASLKQFEPRMHADAAQDPHYFAVEQLADYPHDSFLWVHREGDGAVEWHENQADIFFVQSGSAMLLLGGTMSNAETVGPHEKRNGSIQGGMRRKLMRETLYVFHLECRIRCCSKDLMSSTTT